MKRKPLKSAKETLAMCDIARARRTDPEPGRRLDTMPMEQAKRVWKANRVDPAWMGRK